MAIKETKNIIKKWPLLLITMAVFIIFISIISGYLFFNQDVKNFSQILSQEEKVSLSLPLRYHRLIDGLGVDSINKISPPLWAIIIDNMIWAKASLIGLKAASLVWEAPVEGGITRFLALYPSDVEVKEMGPIRSVRPYFISWAKEWRALLVHVGGSPEALKETKKMGKRDLNQFWQGTYFWRDKNFPSPFNVFTNSQLLKGALVQRKLSQTDYDRGWKFKEKEISYKVNSTLSLLNVSNIIIPYSTFSYQVRWQFEPKENSYLRFQGKKPHQERDGHLIKVKNVAVAFMKMQVLDKIGRLKIETIGQGEALIFHDGIAIKGKWQKKFESGLTRFYDGSGKEIEFNPGLTWIQVVAVGTKVEY